LQSGAGKGGHACSVIAASLQFSHHWAVSRKKGLLMTPLKTPDNRYIVVKGRLWRATNPVLSDYERDRLTKALMAARRQVRDAKRDDDRQGLDQARQDVNAAKIALGERGPVWWIDGAPDYNRNLVKNTPYAQWYATLNH
jgi:hypothetical protein